jgi:hypothetical protein
MKSLVQTFQNTRKVLQPLVWEIRYLGIDLESFEAERYMQSHVSKFIPLAPCTYLIGPACVLKLKLPNEAIPNLTV